MKIADVMDHNARAKSMARKTPTFYRMEIEPAENGGHVVTHFKSGAYREPEKHVFGADEEQENDVAHRQTHGSEAWPAFWSKRERRPRPN